MESTTNNNGKFDGTAQTTNKWFNDLSSAMMDIYNKQSSWMSGFYNNFFGSFPGMNKNPWNSSLNFPNLFFGKYDGLNSMFTPFNYADGRFINLMTAQYEEAYKGIMDFNKAYFEALQEQVDSFQINGNELNNKVQKSVEKEWEATRNIIDSMVDTYNKQSHFSSESNKKFLEETRNLFTASAKRNERLWSEAFKTNQTNGKAEKETEKETEKEHLKKQNNKTHVHHHN